MKGQRPEQALLSRDTDPGRTEDTRRVIEAMVDALNDHRIDDIGEFFADDFVWRGNWGCGTKHGLAAFQDHWQRPFQAAFSNKVAIDEARLFMGEWGACFGAQHAVHSGEFMGVPPTGKRVEIRYMDFWKVRDGKIVENWVSVDFAGVLAQLGEDVFEGEGWRPTTAVSGSRPGLRSGADDGAPVRTRRQVTSFVANHPMAIAIMDALRYGSGLRLPSPLIPRTSARTPKRGPH